MAMFEWLTTAKSELGWWLASIAAGAGLMLAWRWWGTRQSLRDRALQVLGHSQPSQPPWAAGLRLVGLCMVTILTVVVLTPAAPGAGDLEPASETPTQFPTEVGPVGVVVELHADGATIVVHGESIEIRLIAGAATPTTAVADHSGVVEPVTPIVRPTPPANGTPIGME